MNHKQDKDKHLTCNCCNAEVPLSAALTAEGKDYVYHFCDKDCFEQWRKKHKDESKKDKDASK